MLREEEGRGGGRREEERGRGGEVGEVERAGERHSDNDLYDMYYARRGEKRGNYAIKIKLHDYQATTGGVAVQAGGEGLYLLALCAVVGVPGEGVEGD